MAVKLDVLSAEIDQLKSIVASSSAQAKILKAFDEAKALNTPLVGKTAGEENSGIKALNAADFANDGSSRQALGFKNSTTVPQNLQHQLATPQPTAAQLTAGLPGISSKLSPALSDDSKSKAVAITGSEVTESFNGLVLALPTAAALGSVVKSMGSGITSSEVSSIINTAVGNVDVTLQANLPTDLIDQLDLPSIDLNLSSVGAKVTEFADGITSTIKGVLPTVTDLPILDTLHKVNNSTSIVLGNFEFPTNIKVSIGDEILKNLSDNNLSAAEALVKKAIPDIDDLDLNIKITSLNADLGSIGAVLEDAFEALGITRTNTVTGISNASQKYSIVNSLEEVQSEIQNIQRPIKFAIWHWSETNENQVVTAETIEANNGSIPYHYIIRKNGSIQRGELLNEVAVSTGEQSYDMYAIAILIVGGFVNNPGGDLVMESVNLAQQQSVEKLTGAIYNVLPGIQMYGHGEIDESVSTAEPGINIETMIQTKFNKRNEKAPEVIRTHTGNEQNASIAKPGVTFSYQGATFRNQAPQAQLVNILSTVSQITGATFNIYSAGQMSLAEWQSYPVSRRSQSGRKYYIDGNPVRTGSQRHDNGWAVDISVHKNGTQLNFGTESLNADAAQVALALVQQGITGFGAGPGYMGGNIHVDIAFGKNGAGPARHWGANYTSANSPRWLRNLME